MKKLLLLSIAAAITVSVAAQEPAQRSGERNLKLMVRNSNGKVMRGDIMAGIKGAGHMAPLDRFGNRFFSVTDADTLYIDAGSSFYMFPVAGFDSLQVVFKNSKRIAGYVPKEGGGDLVNTGYGTASRRGSSSESSLDMSNAYAYSTLKEYIQGRVSGVTVRGDQLLIRGGVSSISGMTSGAMVVVDGSEMSFAAANDMVRPNNVASISVLKDAGSTSIYGARGANGVVVITTKQGGE